jgi:hypothetical protein
MGGGAGDGTALYAACVREEEEKEKRKEDEREKIRNFVSPT